MYEEFEKEQIHVNKTESLCYIPETNKNIVNILFNIK